SGHPRIWMGRVAGLLRLCLDPDQSERRGRPLLSKAAAGQRCVSTPTASGRGRHKASRSLVVAHLAGPRFVGLSYTPAYSDRKRPAMACRRRSTLGTPADIRIENSPARV